MNKDQIVAWYKQNADEIAGVDEAGRGPLAGPVVAAAVVLPHKHDLIGLDDSKKLTEKKRRSLFLQIQKEALGFEIATINQDIIDDINILQASLRAMEIAFEKLSQKLGSLRLKGVLVDGNQSISCSTTFKQFAVVGGDALLAPIMAASILAKVTRDDYMLEMASLYPQYGFEQHKGYGTQKHMAALESYGPSPIHRKSFAPVRRFFSS